MEVDLIFKIAAIGIVVAVLNQLLVRSDRPDQAMLVSLAGLITTMMLLVREISSLFDLIKSLHLCQTFLLEYVLIQLQIFFIGKNEAARFF